MVTTARVLGALAALMAAPAMAAPLVVLPGEEGTTGAGVAATGPATYDSAYTDLDLGACLILGSDDFGTSWACPGYRGYPLWIAEGDLRFFVSFGFGAPDEQAAGQTMPPFSTLGPRVEWRLQRVGGDWWPVAAIVRYVLDTTEGVPAGGEVLAVYRLGEGTTCQIALVDARANKDANVLARTAADSAASTECPAQPEPVGAFEVW